MQAQPKQKFALKLEREAAPFFLLQNPLATPLFALQFFVSGAATITALPCPRLAPGAEVPLVISGETLAQDSVLIVIWRDANGYSHHWATSF